MLWRVDFTAIFLSTFGDKAGSGGGDGIDALPVGGIGGGGGISVILGESAGGVGTILAGLCEI